MATVKMSESGSVELPQSVRDAHGFKPGVEFEIIDGGREITLRPVEDIASDGDLSTKLAFHEFLTKIPRYDGPPITDEMMHEAINQAAIEDWERLERQWGGEKTDDEDH